MTLRLPAGSRIFPVTVSPGAYTLEACGLVVLDGDGHEVFRVWGTDTDGNNYNAWNFYAGLRAGMSQPTNNTSEGYFNTGIGAEALKSINEGPYNTALGASALTNNTDGGRNTALGAQALYSCSIGFSNVALGYTALASLTTGQQNVAVGDSAGQNLTTGDNNTFLGAYTGFGITTGRANTILGANVSGLAPDTSNEVILADGDGNIRAHYKDGGWILYGNLGLYGTTPPVTQALAIPDATDLPSALTSLNAALQALRTVGLISF